MILWLASYPRSGNTMLRIMFNHAFGMQSYSKHNDINDIGANQEISDIVGHKFIENNWNKAYQRMQSSDQLYLVKTHDPPEDDSKAIYIVRDGRASIVSFFHYLRDYSSREYLLAEIILGFIQVGSWSAHLDAWDPLNRPNTLLIKYEQFLKNPQSEIEKLSDFMGQKLTCQWNNNFEYYKTVSPKFFRSGDSLKNIREIENNELKLFWLFHGDWMNALGYEYNNISSISDCHLLREVSGLAYKRLEAEIFSLKNERNILNDRIERICETLSWRMTSPLRDSRLLKMMSTKFRNLK